MPLVSAWVVQLVAAVGGPDVLVVAAEQAPQVAAEGDRVEAVEAVEALQRWVEELGHQAGPRIGRGAQRDPGEAGAVESGQLEDRRRDVNRPHGALDHAGGDARDA
jgi:hypothetical protein